MSKWFGKDEKFLQNLSAAPSGTPSAFGPQSIAIHFHSGTFLLSFARKKKAALLDTSATSAEAMQKYGYNLQRDGWLNVFTDEKSHAMNNDGVP